MIRWCLLLPSLALICVGACLSPAGAGEYVISQITNNAYDDIMPQIDGNYVVWSGFDGEDWEVFLYNLVTGITVQVTNNSQDDGPPIASLSLGPQISGRHIVWSVWDGNDLEIVVHDILTGITTQVTDDAGNDIFPKVDDGYVVWQGGRVHWGWFVPVGDEVFLYDTRTGLTTQLTDDDMSDWDPQIHGGRIVWQQVLWGFPWAFPGPPCYIMVYDIGTGTAIQLSGNEYSSGPPQIHGDLVAWPGAPYAGGDREIFLHDLARGVTTQVTANNYEDGIEIGGSGSDALDGRFLVWTDFSLGEAVRNVSLYDTLSGTTTRITQSLCSQWQPRIHEGKVVWFDGWGDPDGDVFLYDTATGLTTRLANPGIYDSYPEINKGRVVWTGYDLEAQNCEIFLAVALVCEWLPPVKQVEQGYSYVMQDGSTLPIKLSLTDSTGAFVDEPNLSIVVTDGAGNAVVEFPRSALKVETEGDGRQCYMVNLKTKESGLVVGPTYYIKALVCGQQVGSAVDLVLESGGVAKGR